MLWLEVTGIVALTLVAAYAILKGWRLDTSNYLLRAENARLKAASEQQDAAIAKWHEWARSEGWGQTRVLPIAPSSSHRR